MSVKNNASQTSLLFSFAPHQGTVESIALKDPKERTKMFEYISQSREYAAEYNKKKEDLLKAKEDTQFHFNKKKSAAAGKKQMSKDKEEVKSHKNRKVFLFTQLQWLFHLNPHSHIHNHPQTKKPSGGESWALPSNKNLIPKKNINFPWNYFCSVLLDKHIN